MKIIEKDNIPDDIVNDEESFFETTYFLLQDFKLNIEEMDDYFQRYHINEKSINYLNNQSKKYTIYFEDLEHRSIKAQNSTYMRYLMKDLKKQIKNVSQSYVKKIISIFIAEIILEVSIITHQNIFKEKYMDIFSESVDEDHLKKEFLDILTVVFQPVFEGKRDELYKSDYERFCLYKELHAMYIVNMDNENKCQHIQKQIQNISSLSYDEVTERLSQRIKEIDEQIDHLNTDIDQIYKENDDDNDELSEEDKTVEKLLHLTVDKFLGEDNEEEFSDFISLINADHELSKKEMKIIQQLKAVYQQYFLYDQNRFMDYYEAIRSSYFYLSKANEFKNMSILEYLIIYMFDTKRINADEKTIADMQIEDEYHFAYDISIEFMNLLAFYLWQRGSTEKQYQRIQAFTEIMNEIPECHLQFLEIRENSENDGYMSYESEIFELTPLNQYYNDIVLSVLLKIDIPAVSRRVKKLILSDYDHHYDLSQKSIEMTRVYEEVGINNTNMFYLRDFADLYILSYLKDKKSIATFSPFMRNFHDIYSIYDLIMSPLEGDVICYLNGYDTETDDPEFEKSVHKIAKKFDQLLVDFQQSDMFVLPHFLQLEHLMLVVLGRSLHFYMPSFEHIKLLKKYRYKLITYLSSNDTERFFQQSLSEQIDELVCICVILQIIEHIDQYKEYMPRKNQIQQDDYLDSLKQLIQEKDEMIKIKDQQIENISKKQSTKKINNGKNVKLLEQELKCYKKEITTLNKQLNAKNEEIEKLQNNQDELFKLRNLIFSMQQDDSIEDHSSVDISSIIKDKNIVIIGGHIHTREKLKQKYPSLKILSQVSHINSAVLINADHVFLYYKFMTHDMYNKAISVLSRNDIPWDYIPYTNLEKSEQVIYETLHQ